jgi:hypothetical protein
MTKYELLLRNSIWQKKYRKKLMQRHGNEIINDFALAASDYNFRLKDIAVKYDFTRERARQLFLKLYRRSYGFYQKTLYNDRIRGKRFGNLIAINENENNKWLCKCDCGNTKIVRGGNLLTNGTTSCGCAQNTHGMSNTKAHRRWANMLSRCRCKTHPQYKYYGGRGITVCEEWFKFENFYADMGDCPKGLTIERIDNEGNYEPFNCKWATYKEQANNKRQRQDWLLFEFKGKKLNRLQWAKKMGLGYVTLCHRLKIGWPIEKALAEPLKR